MFNLPKIFQKIVLSFLGGLILLFSFAPGLAVMAQDLENAAWYDQEFWDWHQKVYNQETSPGTEIFGERYTAAQVQWVFYSVGSQIIHIGGPNATAAFVCIMGGNIADCADAIGEAVKSFGPLSGAQISPEGSALSFFDSQPLSGIGYVRQKINNFHLVPEINAQGTGFSAASPIQTLWVAFRNLTFGLMVIVVLIMAFMIMFRVKISPQVVITVQSALPKIAGALVLITFSYAIAGFVIDIMYLVMGIMASFLSSSNISTLSAPDIFKTLNDGNIFTLTLGYLFYFFIGMMSAFMGFGGSQVGQVLSGTAGGLIGYVIVIVAGIVLLIAFFKIFWLLLKTYVSILLQIALGPIQILLGTITPFGGFGAWLKGLAGNLAIYPVVGFMYVLSYFFLAQGFSVIFPPQAIPFFPFPFGINMSILTSTSTWAPPMTLGVGMLGLLWIGVSLVILTLIPKTADIIQSAIAGKPFAYGMAVGESVTGPFATGLKGVSFASDVGKAWATRLGTRGLPPAPAPPAP